MTKPENPMPEDDRRRWQRVTEAFTRASELSGADLDGFLKELERSSPDVHAEVVELLEADREGHPGLTSDGLPAVRAFAGEPSAAADAADGGSDMGEAPESDRHVGRRVGPYEIDGFLARGGMGAVYAAHREAGGFEQEVAIKLLDDARSGAAVMQRFESERSILAGLEHANIARLLDGGTTDDGIPWFAMERVRGHALTDHVREHALDLEARLWLMIEICGAVDFAHRSLVVHRDLKPSNIMVTGDGTPKLLDFGIAKVLETDAAEDPTLTRTGVRVLTPAYASPEQVDGGPITTATDTYALGLLLYELLTGARPWAADLSDAALREAILTTVPAPPSTAASRSAEGRPVEPARLRGDLDLICLKALRKEPDRRYPTAAALADDLRSYLLGRPVSARPDSLGYRVGRWVGRNRGLAGVSAAALVLLLGSTIVYTVNLRAERDRARREEARAGAALEFVTDLFRQSDPSIDRNDTTSVGTFLERGLAELRGRDRSSPDDRAVQATLLSTLGEVYDRLGRMPRADSLLSEAIDLRTAELSAADAEVDDELADMRFALGRVRQSAGDFESAAELMEAALHARVAARGEDDPVVGETLRQLALVTIMRADLDSAGVLATRALDIHRADPGPESVDFAESESALAQVWTAVGDYGQARPLYESALATLEREVGTTDPTYLDQLALLAEMQHDGGFESEAEENFHRLIDLETRIYGRRHPRTATSILSLGQHYSQVGRDADAKPLVEEALGIELETLGPHHHQVATTYNQLGLLAENSGEYAEAERYFRLALETSRYDLGEDHRNRVIEIVNLSRAVGEQGDLDESLRLVKEAEAMANRLADPPNRDWADVMMAEAALYGVMRRYEDAAEAYEQILPYRRETQGPESTYYLGALYGYGQILDRLGRWSQVLPIYEEVASRYRPILGDGSWMMTRVDADLARARMWTAHLSGDPVDEDSLSAIRARLTAWVDTTEARFGTDDRSFVQASEQVAVFDSLFGGVVGG